MSKLLAEIRKAIAESGQTRYRIWKETGIAQPHLLRVLRGEKGLSIEALERLAEYLGLEIMVRPKRGRRRKA